MGDDAEFCFSYTSDRTPAALTLDGNFNELHRLEGKHPFNFVTYIAYRMPDQSLMLFGSAIKPPGAIYISRAVRIDPTLQAEISVDLRREPFYDSGFIKAATPTGIGGEFIAATNLLKQGPDDEARIGGALNFIQAR